MIRIQAWNEFVSPKFYGPLAIWPWLRISSQSSLNVIYLIITAWQCLMSFPYMPCIPMQNKSIKACQGKGQGTLPLREWLCHPFSSTGLGSPCEFVSSQPQRHGHCLPMTVSLKVSNFPWFVLSAWLVPRALKLLYPARISLGTCNYISTNVYPVPLHCAISYWRWLILTGGCGILNWTYYKEWHPNRWRG